MDCTFDFSPAALAGLETQMRGILSPARFAHVQGVAAMTRRLSDLCCPEKTPLLTAAALLHDCTKELSDEEHRAILAAHGVTLRPDEAACPQVWHGITAALEIPRRYPSFAAPEVISAVRWHTTAHAGLTLGEAIVCLSDCIEEGRPYPTAVALREKLFAAKPETLPLPARLDLLREILLQMFRHISEHLAMRGFPVCRDSAEALAYLENEKHPFERT